MLENLNKYKVILASNSPRRKELLSGLGIDYEVKTLPDVDESYPDGLSGEEIAKHIARGKAEAYRSLIQADELVITADTIVWLDGTVMGKPKDEADAAATLQLLSGRDHQVMTGMTVLRDEEIVTHTEVTKIHFRELSPAEIRAYIASGEPMDKAGAYGIQGGAALFCTHMVGDYYNVMGLPVCALGQRLKELAPQLMEETL